MQFYKKVIARIRYTKIKFSSPDLLRENKCKYFSISFDMEVLMSAQVLIDGKLGAKNF